MLPDIIRECFGEPRAYSSTDAWRSVEVSTGPLPVNYKEFCASYGPGVIGKFLKVLHPESSVASMRDAISDMAPLYHELYPEKIPCEVYPFVDDGAVLWALSAESDAFFLIPSATGGWKIGVWFRQWAEWEEYSDDVPVWLARQAAGDLDIPGLPLSVYGGFTALD